MIRILHAADLHLDSPFSALSPEQAAQRRGEQRLLLRELFEAANQNSCDLVLLAGDLFDSDNVCPDTMEALRRAMAGCMAKIFIAPGNHDCLTPGSAYLTESWPENVHIFKKNTVEAVELSEPHCRIYGAGFQSAYEKPMLQGFRAAGDGRAEIMVLHGDALTADSPYNAVTKEQIAASGLSYLAMGHIHAASGLLKAGDTYYAWPGCAMGRGFDELGQKGAYLVDVDENGCRAEFLPLGARKYEILRVEAGDDAMAAIEAALPAQTENDSYRIILTGESDAIRVSDLYRALCERFFSLSIRDETTPRRALWAGMEGDTLRGLFLRTLREQYDAAGSEEDRRRIALAARLGTDAMDGREESL